MNESTNTKPWGRVDESNTVYVLDGENERVVGQYPDGTPEEALAYFSRKFDDLAGQVKLLEQRINAASAGVDVAQSIDKLSEQLVEPAVVGNLPALRARVDKLKERASTFVEKQRAERAEQKQQAIAAREAIVVEAETLAAQPEQQVRWKDASAQMEQLFARWQETQRSGPNISKGEADALWKRFRAARTTFDAARRRFFAQMDSANKDVKHAKERLITQAEALASQGSEGIPSYRRLLDEWKLSGRANRKLDDQLWARFKAAGDVLYQVKAEEVALTNEEFSENLSKKQALLSEAEPILKITDHTKARAEITKIQLRWDEIGKVPRESIREVEGQLRKIEDHVKKLEDDHWSATNPETIARSEGLKGQLEDSIADLQQRITAAEAAGDARAASEAKTALETQQSWLKAIGG